jgi:hypothetical protein
VADLPCAGFRVQLILHVRRFFCDTADCIRKIFTERNLINTLYTYVIHIFWTKNLERLTMVA